MRECNFCSIPIGQRNVSSIPIGQFLLVKLMLVHLRCMLLFFSFVVVMDTLSDQVDCHKTRLDTIAMEMEYMSSFKDEFLPSFSASEKLQW